MKDSLFIIPTMISRDVINGFRGSVEYLELRDVVINIISNWLYKEKQSINLMDGIEEDRLYELKADKRDIYINIKRALEDDLERELENVILIADDDKPRAMDILLTSNSIILYITTN